MRICGYGGGGRSGIVALRVVGSVHDDGARCAVYKSGRVSAWKYRGDRNLTSLRLVLSFGERGWNKGEEEEEEEEEVVVGARAAGSLTPCTHVLRAASLRRFRQLRHSPRRCMA